MQAITKNPISQAKHGPYKAVDYSASPDPYYYAPEDGKITAWGDSGSCGKRLELTGATGRHGFCHNELAFVGVGDNVKRGQKLAKMGYTGYTIPSGPAGRHVHWVINRNGTYVYPPSKVNQSFIKLGEEDMPTEKNVRDWFAKYRFKKPTATQLSKYTKNPWRVLATDVANALLSDYKKAKAAGPESNDQALKDSLFNKIKGIFGK